MKNIYTKSIVIGLFFFSLISTKADSANILWELEYEPRTITNLMATQFKLYFNEENTYFVYHGLDEKTTWQPGIIGIDKNGKLLFWDEKKQNLNTFLHNLDFNNDTLKLYYSFYQAGAISFRNPKINFLHKHNGNILKEYPSQTKSWQMSVSLFSIFENGVLKVVGGRDFVSHRSQIRFDIYDNFDELDYPQERQQFAMDSILDKIIDYTSLTNFYYVEGDCYYLVFSNPDKSYLIAKFDLSLQLVWHYLFEMESSSILTMSHSDDNLFLFYKNGNNKKMTVIDSKGQQSFNDNIFTDSDLQNYKIYKIFKLHTPGYHAFIGNTVDGEWSILISDENWNVVEKIVWTHNDFKGALIHSIIQKENGNIVAVIPTQRKSFYFAEIIPQYITSVSDKNANSKIKINPHPVIDYLEIETDLIYSSVEIYSLEGRRLLDFPFANKIDVSNLPGGVYIMKIENSSIKFIKE